MSAGDKAALFLYYKNFKLYFTFFEGYGIVLTLSRSGGMADALASGASGSNTVWVQVPSPALTQKGRS